MDKAKYFDFENDVIPSKVIAGEDGLEAKVVEVAEVDGALTASAATSIVSGNMYYLSVRGYEQNMSLGSDYPQPIKTGDSVIVMQQGQVQADFGDSHGFSVGDKVELDATNVFVSFSSGTVVGWVRSVDGNIVVIDFDFRSRS